MRTKEFLKGKLIPYTYLTVDRGVDKAFRIADLGLNVMKNTVSLNYPTKLVLETIDILKRYGLSGLAGVLLRRDFLEAVETLKRISGMDKMFSMSLHELTACIYYKLAIDRGLRGCDPDGEKIAHDEYKELMIQSNSNTCGKDGDLKEDTELLHRDIEEAIRLAPLALDAVYEESEVECQRVARSQGWTTLFSHTASAPEQPAYAVFVTPHEDVSKTPTAQNNAREKEVILAIRGTHTVHDLVTDIRAAPQRFPPESCEIEAAIRGKYRPPEKAPEEITITSLAAMERSNGASGIWRTLSEDSSTYDAATNITSPDGAITKCHSKVYRDRNACPERVGLEDYNDEDYLTVKLAQWEWSPDMENMTYACTGMAKSAVWLLSQIGPTLMQLHSQGYKIILTGHSLGAAVAVLMVSLLKDWIPLVRAVVYGCPSCVDDATADDLWSRVSSVVLHDDVICRITPQSIRLLMSELMVFRDQVFRHLSQDWADVIERAGTLWSPRWRQAHNDRQQKQNGYIDAPKDGVDPHGCSDSDAEGSTRVSESEKCNSDFGYDEGVDATQNTPANTRPHLHRNNRHQNGVTDLNASVATVDMRGDSDDDNEESGGNNDNDVNNGLNESKGAAEAFDQSLNFGVTGSQVLAHDMDVEELAGSTAHTAGKNAQSQASGHEQHANAPLSAVGSGSASGPGWFDYISTAIGSVASVASSPLKSASATSFDQAEGEASNMVMVDEEKIPELWLPGRVLHLYSYRGQYRVQHVSREFPSLRRIEVQGHIFANHTSAAIFDALLEVRSLTNVIAHDVFRTRTC